MISSILRPRNTMARALFRPRIASVRAFHPAAVAFLPKEDFEQPTHAATVERHKGEYPDRDKRDPNDVGHTTVGPVGRHVSRTLKSFSLEGRVCLVTGGARGLGNLMARSFVESGANQIAVVDLDEFDAKSAAKDIEDWYVKHGEAVLGEIEAIGIGCDVADETSVQAAINRVKDKFGKLDVVVTAAGIVENFPALEYPTERMRKLFRINVEGSFFFAREAAKLAIETNTRGLSIVLISSMSANVVNVPQPQTPYNASKAAVKHMAASLAVEWAYAGVRVNAISPGYMQTSLTKTILDKPENHALRNKWISLTPAGRLGDPEDLKGAAVFLASEASAFCTGSEIKVDGGYTIT